MEFIKKYYLLILTAAGFPFFYFLPEAIDPYVELVIKYIGINIILAISLNLVNGYMGEFSVGHAGFMAIGAYVSSICTVWLFPSSSPYLFPFALFAGVIAAGIAGYLIAIPSFRTRGDYLAIVTLAFLMIVKSVIENMESLGAARGFLGMEKYTGLVWVFGSVVLSIILARNFIYSRFGRGVIAIREDEIASGLCGVDTKKVKIYTFIFSASLAGLAGGLFAHELQFINPRSFGLLKSTDMLVMVYLGGVGSISGSILGAITYTALLEILRPVTQFTGLSQEWRLVVAPLLLIILMIFRPRGIMGFREFPFLIPESLSTYKTDSSNKDNMDLPEVATKSNPENGKTHDKNKKNNRGKKA